MGKGFAKPKRLPKKIKWKCFLCDKELVADRGKNFLTCSCGCSILQFAENIYDDLKMEVKDLVKCECKCKDNFVQKVSEKVVREFWGTSSIKKNQELSPEEIKEMAGDLVVVIVPKNEFPNEPTLTQFLGDISSSL